MNDQIQNINSETQAESLPVTVFDKDGNFVEVKHIEADKVQDIEYSEDPRGN